MSHIVYEQITNKPARLIETRGDGMAIYEMVECRSRVVCLPESMMLVPSMNSTVNKGSTSMAGNAIVN